MAIEADLAAARAVHLGQQVEDRRLATLLGPISVCRAAPDLKVDVRNRLETEEFLGQALRLQDDVHGS